MKQEDAAEKLGVSRVTLSRWENAERPKIRPDVLTRMAALYRKPLEELVGNKSVARETAPARPGGSSALAQRLKPAAYEVALTYLRRLRSAGLPDETVDEAERLMLDSTYNKLHARDPRERTEEEQIVDLDAAWAFITLILREQGIRL